MVVEGNGAQTVFHVTDPVADAVVTAAEEVKDGLVAPAFEFVYQVVPFRLLAALSPHQQGLSYSKIFEQAFRCCRAFRIDYSPARTSSLCHVPCKSTSNSARFFILRAPLLYLGAF